MKQKLDEILSEHNKRSEIIPILQDIQKNYRYLPKEMCIRDRDTAVRAKY